MEDDNDNGLDREYKTLQTRAKVYHLKIENEAEISPSTSKTKRVNHQQYFLKCYNHHTVKTWSAENNCSNYILFQPAVLPNGRLPTLKRVIEYFYYLGSLDSSSVEYNGTLDLINHWIKCNIYTQTRKSVQSRLTAYFDKLKYLKDYPKNKKKDMYWKQYSEFVSASKQLFDIIASNDRIKAQEKLWKVKMIEADCQFHRNMLLVPQVGYCSSTDKQ